MKIKDLPVNELPRERFVLYGKENLSNSDLISIVLRTGIKNKSVREISDNILSYVGDINNLNNGFIRI